MTTTEHFAAIARRVLADVITGQPVTDPRGARMPNLPPDAYDALYDVMPKDPTNVDPGCARFWRLVGEHPQRLYAAARWWSQHSDDTSVGDARTALMAIAEDKQEATR
jgi:hypothetical protein